MALCRVSGRCRPYFRTARAPAGPGRRGRARSGATAPAAGLIFSQLRQENFSRTCWITFHWRGTQLQRLGHVLAQLVQRAAAARAGARRRVDDALARQVLGQRPARRLAAARTTARPRPAARRSLPPPRPRPALSSSSNSCSSSWSSSAPRSDDWPNRSCRSLAIVCSQLLDLEPAPGLGLGRRSARFGQPCRALRSDHRLQRVDVVGERFSGGDASQRHCRVSRAADATMLDACRVAVSHQPATCGRQVRCGSRQSIPSSR